VSTAAFVDFRAAQPFIERKGTAWGSRQESPTPRFAAASAAAFVDFTKGEMKVTLAITYDNVGGNDPEVMMTLCMWVAKLTHYFC
jgi:glycerol-3-phosphate acyltransferase PlsY